jgi:hypothetical protein
MADSTISQLPVALTVSAGDLIPIDQGGVTKRATLGQLGNGTVLVAPGKTFSVNNSLTLAGTDGTTMTFPATSASMARTDAAQSFAGLQTFTNGITTPAQVTSTIATGTAPLVVASTTPVANLSIGGNAATSSSTTGNAATATALQNIRTIDGVNFDGTANITVVAPATHAAPSKTTPVSADEFPIYDSISGLLNKVTFANGIKGTSPQSITMVANAATLVLSNLYNNYIDVSGVLTATGQITTTFPTNATQVTFDNSTTGGFLLQINAGAYTLPSGKSVWIWNGTLFEIVSEVTSATLPPAFRNRVINGDMSVWQIATTQALTTAFAYGGADMFAGACANNSQATISKTTSTVPGLPNALKLQRTNGVATTGAQYVNQVMEVLNIQPLQGQLVAFSYWAKAGANYSSASSLLSTQVNTGTGADATSLTSTFGGWTGNAVPYTGTDTLTTSWQRFTHVFTLGASVTQAGFMFSYTPVGTAGADDSVSITGVQFEPITTGTTVPTAFEVLPYEAQLRRCKRYLPYFSFANGNQIGPGICTSATAALIFQQFPVPTRAGVSGITIATGAAAQFSITSNVGSTATGVTFNGTGTGLDNATFNMTGMSGLTAGYACAAYLNNTASYYFTGSQL